MGGEGGEGVPRGNHYRVCKTLCAWLFLWNKPDRLYKGTPEVTFVCPGHEWRIKLISDKLLSFRKFSWSLFFRIFSLSVIFFILVLSFAIVLLHVKPAVLLWIVLAPFEFLCRYISFSEYLSCPCPQTCVLSIFPSFSFLSFKVILHVFASPQSHIFSFTCWQPPTECLILSCECLFLNSLKCLATFSVWLALCLLCLCNAWNAFWSVPC